MKLLISAKKCSLYINLKTMHCTKAARAMPLQLAVRRTKLVMGSVPQLPSGAHVHII